MNIAVTGSRGFIGGHLIPALSQAGHQVQGLDHGDGPAEPTHRVVTGDILDPDKVLQALAGADTVIHLAAEHKDYGLTKEDYYRANQQGTRTVLECAGGAGVSQFI
ncbi:MAG: NAD(P)-dependent oxidoreductase, partial [Candidatus Neomarinimicrobiota bacterium]